MRLRRSKEEIEAGLTVDMKRRGITLVDLYRKKANLEGPAPKFESTKGKPGAPRIRRSKEEIDAGMTVEQKKAGLSIQDVENLKNPPEPDKPKKRLTRAQGLERLIHKEKEDRKQQKAEARKRRRKEKESKYARVETRSILIDATEAGQSKMPTRTVFKDKIIEVPVEVPTIKEVRILNGTKKTQKTVEEIMKEELQKCKWEWKELKMDKNFDFKKLQKLGEQGWKHAHTMSWRLLKPSWKDKPDSMYFQRPRYEDE